MVTCIVHLSAVADALPVTTVEFDAPSIGSSNMEYNTIPYSYAESEGGQTGFYWAYEVANSMAIRSNVIQRNPAELEK